MFNGNEVINYFDFEKSILNLVFFQLLVYKIEVVIVMKILFEEMEVKVKRFYINLVNDYLLSNLYVSQFRG